MNERRHDLDWLRVIAILLLHFYHAAMPFVAEWGWHIKNAETSSLLMEVNYFLSKWRMPLLFFISGVGTTFVLSQYSAMGYFKQRVKRLLVPLCLGMLLVVPPQVYFERIFYGSGYTSYIDFYPSVFHTGPYPAGNLSWHHLWFIAYLFVYSVIAIPCFLFFNSVQGGRLARLVAKLPARLGLYGLGLLLYFAGFLYFWFPSETHALVDDWAGFTRYFLFFLFGCFIGTRPSIWIAIEDNRRLHLKLAFFSIVVINVIRWNNMEPAWGISPGSLIFIGLQVFNIWFWVLAILGYGKRYLNFKNRLLSYTNEGIYPFYILHQTFIVMVAYYVVPVDESILSKYIFLTFVSFVLSIGVYAFLIKPYDSIRFMFGMKSAGSKKRSQAW